MNSVDIGRKAEKAASTYLEMRGFVVLERNWRRPRCEIDIIAEKDNTIYFVEVKYRRNDNQGGGLEAITPTKLKQMRFAATSWLVESKWRGSSRLAAVELAGPDYTVLSFLDDIY